MGRMRELKYYEQVNLFKRYSSFPFTRGMSGNIFEAYCHTIFSSRIKFDFVLMVRIGGQPTFRDKKMHQYHSSHTEFSGTVQSQALEGLRVSALTSGASLHISRPTSTTYQSKPTK